MFRENNTLHSSLRILSHLWNMVVVDMVDMAWACFAASWPGQPAIIDGTMNSELYQQILKENVRTSV